MATLTHAQFCPWYRLFTPFSPVATGFGYGPPPPPPDQFAPPGVPPPPATPGAAPLAFPPPPSQAAPDMSKPPTAQPDFPYGQYGKWLWPAAPRMGRSRRAHQAGFGVLCSIFRPCGAVGSQRSCRALGQLPWAPSLQMSLGESLWCSHRLGQGHGGLTRLVCEPAVGEAVCWCRWEPSAKASLGQMGE